MECPVCCEESSKQITCGCGFSACQTCARKYILGSFEDAQCMSCKRAFTRADLVRGLGKTFVAVTYKQHREQTLLDRERAMLPATQSRLDTYRRCAEVERGMKARMAEYRALLSHIRDLKDEAYQAKRRIEYDRAIVSGAKARAYGPIRGGRSERAVDRVLCGCPKAACNGFVLASNHECGACKSKICNRCHVLLSDDDHACDPSDVASAKAIMKETKPCPRCNVPIFKSYGCYQMFCTQCQCVFDWSNGKEIRTGAIHNPHYFEWLRTRGGAPPAREEHACGGFREVYAVLHALPRKLAPGAYDALSKRVRNAGHIDDLVLRALQPRDVVQDNTVLRLKFLNGELSEAQFKTALQRAEKKRAKDEDVRQLLAMYVAVVQTTVINIPRGAAATRADIDAARAELDSLDRYTEAQLTDLNEVFGSKDTTLMKYFRA